MSSELVAPEPEHCPGTGSEDAGKASACDGCPNQKICASSTPAVSKNVIFSYQEIWKCCIEPNFDKNYKFAAA